jgi:hypothetical protein
MAEEPKVNKRSRKQAKIAAIAIVLVGVLLITLVTARLTTPKRSVAAYCQVFETEKARLAKLSGNTYSSVVFNNSVSNAGDYAKSFAKLEKVAPEDVQPDVAALKTIYQKIYDDPSQATSASLSGISAESNVSKWTHTQCHTN